MSTLIKRTITGTALVGITVISVTASPYSFIALLLLVNCFSLFEFYRLAAQQNLRRAIMEGGFVSLIFFASISLVLCRILHWPVLLINIFPSTIILIRGLYQKTANVFQNLSLTFFGIFYITLPIILFETIAFLPFHQARYNPTIILGYFLILWANDTGAYLTGSSIGKHSLLERISPKKTWEGSIGGALCALGTAYMVSRFADIVTFRDWLIIGLIIVVMGTYGDLFKSLLKRSIGVKDSGTLLPGHGGVLDRFDSLIGSAPMVFCYLALLQT